MKSITLALGGGGTKGYAHIGVIKQLSKYGYAPSAIAGTSAGGIIGALYAAGYSIAEIETIAHSINFSKLFSINIYDSPSLIGLGGLHSLLKKYLEKKTFSDTIIPFAVTSVDSKTGYEYVINSGFLIDAVKATIAIPGIFPAYIHQDKNLVDGAVLNPIPVNIARWLNENDPVLAISLSAPPEKWPLLPKYEIPSFVPIPHFFAHQFSQMRLGKALESMTQSLELMINMITWLRLREDQPDVLINPAVYKYSMIEDVDVDELVKLGEKSVEEKINEISNAYTLSRRIRRWVRASKVPGKFLEVPESSESV
jgi:NTE family protein